MHVRLQSACLKPLLPIASEPARNVLGRFGRLAAECGMNIAAAKKPGGDPPGFSQRWMSRAPKLENAEYDCADKGKGEVGRHHAQLTEERTKGHGGAPKVTSLTALNAQASHRFHDKKVSGPVHRRHLGGAQSQATWLKSREIKMLMSP